MDPVCNPFICRFYLPKSLVIPGSRPCTNPPLFPCYFLTPPSLCAYVDCLSLSCVWIFITCYSSVHVWASMIRGGKGTVVFISLVTLLLHMCYSIPLCNSLVHSVPLSPPTPSFKCGRPGYGVRKVRLFLISLLVLAS